MTVDMMYDELTYVERASKWLLGSKHRATVWSAIAQFTIEPPQSFTYEGLRSRMGTELTPANSQLVKEVKTLSRLGMVEEVKGEGGREVTFRRVASELWLIIEATADVFGPEQET